MISHVSALIDYIEIKFRITYVALSFLESTWKTKVRVHEYFCNGLCLWKLIFIWFKVLEKLKLKFWRSFKQNNIYLF